MVRIHREPPFLSRFFFSPKFPSSSGLGHLPFTEDTGVRIPLGTPIFFSALAGLFMNLLFKIDGAAFVLIGIIVLLVPSPQPALNLIVDEISALPPFKDTRRLLASQFFGNGLLALVFGYMVSDFNAERAAAFARLATLVVVLVINFYQLRGGYWKRLPLFIIAFTLSSIFLTYSWLLVR